MNVLQEQSLLLYVIAGLLAVLVVVGILVWMRLGELVDATRMGGRRDEPKLMSWRDRPVVHRPEPGEPTSDRPPRGPIGGAP